MPQVQEQRRPIPRWPNHEVSDLGRFVKKACRDGRGYLQPAHELKVHVQKYDKQGHLHSFVSLYDCGRHETVSAGRTVLLVFRGPPPEGKNCCRHLDDDIANNKLSNLVWGTQKENVHDAIRNGLRVTYGESVHTAKLTADAVHDIRANCRPWVRGKSIRDFARQYDVHEDTVRSVVANQSWRREKHACD